MIITFLGTGTSQGIPVIGCHCAACSSDDHRDRRLRSALHVLHNGVSILIDTGPDLRQQLLTNNITDIDAILITHEHNDHIAGLDDIRPINFLHNKTLPLYTLTRVADALESRFPYVFEKEPYPGSPRIELHSIQAYQSFDVQQCSILPIEVNHGLLKILGYRIGNMAYLTDVSKLDDDAIGRLHGLDILVISALQQAPHHAHLSVSEAVNIAQVINARETYFIHMSHNLGKTEDWSATLPHHIMPAYDGLKISI